MLLLYFFLTEKMVMWQYFWQTLCYCDIILDSLLLSLQYFLTLEVLSWQMWDISIAIVIFFLTELMVMWLYFWQSLCYCDIILDSLLLTLHISWHKKGYRDTPGTFLVLSLYFFLTELMVMWLHFFFMLSFHRLYLPQS